MAAASHYRRAAFRKRGCWFSLSEKSLGPHSHHSEPEDVDFRFWRHPFTSSKDAFVISECWFPLASILSPLKQNSETEFVYFRFWRSLFPHSNCMQKARLLILVTSSHSNIIQKANTQTSYRPRGCWFSLLEQSLFHSNIVEHILEAQFNWWATLQCFFSCLL